MNRLPRDPNEMHRLIQNAGSLYETNMLSLRRAQFAGKLGCHVREDIAAWLTRANLGWWPRPLPNDQDHRVLLYALDSDAGQLLDIAFRMADAQRREEAA